MRGERNAVTRLFHGKNDKETIATWRSDLNRILHVFNVRSVASVRPLLTVRFQTELAINTHVVVSDIRRDFANTHTVVSDIHRGVLNVQTIASDVRHGVTNTHAVVSNIGNDVVSTRTIVSEVHQGVVNTHTIVSDIHRTIVEGQEGIDGKNRLVGVTCTPPATK